MPDTDHDRATCGHDWCTAHRACTCAYATLLPHTAAGCRYATDDQADREATERHA